MQKNGKYEFLQNGETPFGANLTYAGNIQQDTIDIIEHMHEVNDVTGRFVDTYDKNLIKFFGHPLERYENGRFTMYNGIFCSCCGKFIPAPFRKNREKWKAHVTNCRLGYEPINMTTYHVLACGFNEVIPNELAMYNVLMSRGTQVICDECCSSPNIGKWIDEFKTGFRIPKINCPQN